MACEIFATGLTIYEAQVTRSFLLNACMASNPEQGVLEIDLTQVTEFDGAGLQLLLSLARTAKEHDLLISLCQVPVCVSRVLQEFDVASRFLMTRSGAPA